ncbi:hypothetical protein DSO57_1030983 [Entomophthora muscae]|uniref:Uncharacterized protein n=1 Tax=Entomophthora muscae TaxID=34485 RepID=A0ACC2SDN9_9FUNG|nr:hypothetical protein DSO57_1030983 [Entomophthora muscae]
MDDIKKYLEYIATALEIVITYHTGVQMNSHRKGRLCLECHVHNGGNPDKIIGCSGPGTPTSSVGHNLIG